MVRKIAFIFLMSLGFTNVLLAQTSANNYRILTTDNIGNFSTSNDFQSRVQEYVTTWNRLLEIRGKYNRYVFVTEPTRMEGILIDRAYQELPERPSNGSGWYIIDLFDNPLFQPIFEINDTAD
jgi:hypothetical protein